MTATVEIEIIPPGPPGTKPWWTILWDGAQAKVRTAVPALVSRLNNGHCGRRTLL